MPNKSENNEVATTVLTQEQQDALFDDSFNEALTTPPRDEFGVAPVTDPVVDPVTDPVADPVTDPVADPVTDPVADPVTDPVAAPVTDPVAKDPAVDFQALLAAQKADFESQLADLKKAKEPEEKPAGQLSDEEKTTLEAFNTEWPQVNAAMQIQNRVMEEKVASLVKDAMSGLLEKISPHLKTVEQVATNTFTAAVEKVHSDATTLLPQLEAWIEKQPTMLQAAYNDALDNGSVADVVAVYDTYKQMNPAPAAVAPVTPAAVVVPDVEGQQRLAAMEDHGGERLRNSSDTVDENDFDGAFAQATRNGR